MPVKLGYCEKATKFEKISQSYLTLLSNAKKIGRCFSKGPGAKNDTSKSPGCFNQILTFESRKWSPVATF